MESLEVVKSPQIRIVENDFAVDFELEIAGEILSKNADYISLKEQEIEIGLKEVENALNLISQKKETLNAEIDNLTNTSDSIDYIIAVSSGILAGIVDSLWVGEFSLDRGREWSDKKVNSFVVKIAQSQGYKKDDLEGAVRHLEDNFPLASDSNTPEFGCGRQHHLRDFAHHPSPIGLLFSMLTQFTGKSYGTSTAGSFMIVEIKDKKLIGKDLPQKLLFGTIFWFFHMVSDMAGSSTTISEGKRGTGLPGPLVSLVKLISTLPIFKETDKDGNKIISVWVSKLFNGDLFLKRDGDGKIIKDSVKNFDLRSEIGVAYELGRQAIPVLLNECIVRGFYFTRRLITEIKKNNINKVSELNRIEWNKTLPFKNRTIIRMLTISTGTFTLIDLGDAAIRGAIKSGGQSTLFLKEFLLRVNFVGVGRFALAITTDISMGIKREKLRNERIGLISQQLQLLNAKVFYLEANMWKTAESAAQTIEDAKIIMEETATIAAETWEANRISMNNIGSYCEKIEQNNKGLTGDIIEILEKE